ncbi:hypothetical protein [Metabacillus schmidteae]|uniref:hypothetical protein n=1 Tax=Metabacillus schmidteae TaxID=2730405 RepID=UPI001589068A|nr:hypothetical protein [Metabacillus schmidteae]
MKRYWKLISVVLVIVLGIGIHYYQSATAASNNPQFTINKISGNSEEGNNIKVLGEIYSTNGFRENLYIDEEKTVYQKEISFLEDLNGMYFTPELKRLQNDYRNFMRGKDIRPVQYFEDETYIAYMITDMVFSGENLGPSETTFRGEVLDKQTNTVVDINETMPNQNVYDYAFVEDVQMINGDLKVVVRQSKRVVDGDQYSEEIHVYTFDTNSQMLINDETLVSETNGQDILSDFNDIDYQEYLLIQKSNEEVTDSSESTKESNSELIAYNFESSKLIKIPISKEQLKYNTIIIDGSKIYMFKIAKDSLETFVYSIDEGQLMPTKTFKINGLEEDSNPIIKIENNKLYVVNPLNVGEKDGSVVVTDLTTLKPLYEGTIENTNLSKYQENYTLHLNSLYID